MCGIYGYVGARSDAAALVAAGLRQLAYRGYDSWGVAAARGGALALTRRVGPVDPSQAALPAGKAALGHTRWATHGGVTESNAHPHLDCQGQVAVVHNGIVENAAALRAALGVRGHTFRSETDTEVVAHLVEEELATAPSLHHALLAAFRRLAGVNGVALLDRRGDGLVAATSGAPLLIALSPTGAYLASDAAALPADAAQLIVLDAGQLAVIAPRCVRVLDMALGAWVPPRTIPPERSAAAAELGAGEYWMEREIREQPRLLRLLADDAADEAARLAAAIQAASSVTWVGCGTAYHAALAGRYALASAGARSHAVPGSEFASLADAVEPGGLLIALSQSGETIDVLDAVRAARSRGAHVTVLVNAAWSTLARLADDCLCLRAGPERCVLATKSFLAKLAVITLVEAALRGDMRHGQAALRRAADAIERLLESGEQARLAALAGRLAASEHLFCLGRGRSTPLALEAALKIKEGSYLHAEGFAAGELKHGVIALVEAGTPCLLFAPPDATQAAVIAAAMEVQARGALTIALASAPLPGGAEWIPVRGDGADWQLTATVAAQCLAYYLALRRGCNPDRPRNLAKSVTVR